MGQEVRTQVQAVNGSDHSPVNHLQISGGTGEQRGERGRFLPGQSGNPAGRPRGVRNRGTLLAQAMIDNEAETLIRTVLDKALYKNDPVALRLCVERILSPRRTEPVDFELPPMATAADAPKALDAIAQAVADGELAPAEAGHLSALVDRFVHAIETRELEGRIQALEEAEAKLHPHGA